MLLLNLPPAAIRLLGLHGQLKKGIRIDLKACFRPRARFTDKVTAKETIVRIPVSVKVDRRGRLRRYCRRADLNQLPAEMLQVLYGTSAIAPGHYYDVPFARVVFALANPNVDLHGKHVHHNDGDTLHDKLRNLEALTPGEHARLHVDDDPGFFDYVTANRDAAARVTFAEDSAIKAFLQKLGNQSVVGFPLDTASSPEVKQPVTHVHQLPPNHSVDLEDRWALEDRLDEDHWRQPSDDSDDEWWPSQDDFDEDDLREHITQPELSPEDEWWLMQQPETSDDEGWLIPPDDSDDGDGWYLPQDRLD